MGQPIHDSEPEPILPASGKDGTTALPARSAAEARLPPAPLLAIEIDDGPSKVVLQSTQHAEQLIQQYVQELKTEIAIGVEPLPPPSSERRLIWGLGLGLLAASLMMCLLLMHQSQMLTASGQAAALHALEQCTERQAEVMDAIANYTRDHGEAPADLARLTPGYLDVPPSDPSTGEPFKYASQGSVAWLACPQHPLPPFQKAAGDPARDAPDEVVEAAPAAVAPEVPEDTVPEGENEIDHRVAAEADAASPERQNPPE